MFVRTKTIKNNEYAYLVENEWQPWGSRQKTLKYLGKTIRPEKKNETNRQELKPEPDWSQTIKKLIERELQEHELKRTEILSDYTIKREGKEVVLAMNQGFLCRETATQLLNYKPQGIREKDAKKLAEMLLETGIIINEQEFLQLFEMKS